MKKGLIFILLAAGAAAATVLPAGVFSATGVLRRANVISMEQERLIGTKITRGILAQAPLSRDPLANRKVTEIGQRLSQGLPSLDYDFRFYLIDDPSPNAFTIPGGTIFVHRGLIDFADDESQIAGVIAHEIVHAYKRHPLKALSRALGIQYLSHLFIPGQANPILSFLSEFATRGALAGEIRAAELEADREGQRLLQGSGYRADGLTQYLRKVEGLNPAKQRLLNTHPSLPERIARLEALNRD